MNDDFIIFGGGGRALVAATSAAVNTHSLPDISDILDDIASLPLTLAALDGATGTTGTLRVAGASLPMTGTSTLPLGDSTSCFQPGLALQQCFEQC